MKELLERGKRRFDAKKIETNLEKDAEFSLSKLQAGDTFGNFSEAKGRIHKN